jgi:hypothetical protein
MKKIAIMVAGFLCCVPGYAQWSVIDVPETAQVIKILKQGKQQFDFWQAQAAQMQGMVNRYRVSLASLQHINARDAYGTIGGLADSANTGYGADAGYRRATVPLVFRTLDGLPVQNILRLRSRYGQAEMADGSNVAAYSLVGDVRAKAAANRSNLDQLQMDTLDGTASTLQVAQKNAAASAIAAKQLDALTQVQAAQLEQAVLASQRSREEEVDRLNAEAKLHDASQAVSRMVENLPAGGVATLVVP